MKALIWIGCLFIATFLNVLIGEALGFRLGYILLYLLVSFIAKKLCNKWEEHKESRQSKAAYKAHINSSQGDAETKRVCKTCGSELLENSQYCRICGAEIL